MWKLTVAVAVLCAALPATAGAATEDDLAQRYAPVVRVVDQPEECGPGEPYEPIDVDALFDEDTVSLRGPWTSNDLIQVAQKQTRRHVGRRHPELTGGMGGSRPCCVAASAASV